MSAARGCLVVGATGQVGGAAALRLKESGCNVRALVRGDMARPAAVALTQAGVELIPGDLGDEASLRRALSGMSAVVCTVTAMPNAGGDALQRVDHDGVLALIDAARQAGVRRFVYTSYSGNIQTDSPLARAKRACEARLASIDAMESLILRPSYFMEVWLGPHVGIDVRQGRARIFGAGSAPVSYVSAPDVAAFAAAAAMRQGNLREVLEIGGPEAVSQLEAVALFERLSGRPFEREHVPMAALEQQHRSDDPLQQTFAALMIAFALGDAIPGAQEVARRYGVRLTALEEYARQALLAAGEG
jgi:uncharacterized protein YbjT (DUF2867 family)